MEATSKKEAPIMRTPVKYNEIPWRYRSDYSGLCTFERKSYAEGDSEEMVVIINRNKEGPFKETFKNGTVEEGYYKNNRRIGIARRVYENGRVETLDYGDGSMDCPIYRWFGEIQDRPKTMDLIRQEISSAALTIKRKVLGLFAGNDTPILHS